MNKDTQFLQAIKSLPDNSVTASIFQLHKPNEKTNIRTVTYKVEIEYTTEINENDVTNIFKEIKEELVAKGDVLLLDKVKYIIR